MAIETMIYTSTVEAKYGLTKMNATHHHTETLEVKDSKNRLILPGGQKVDSSFKITCSP